MRIKLKSLRIENFKGIKEKSIDFTDKTEIKGQNATGKTTIFDAFTWLLFNKNSAGNEKFNIRPLDSAGKRIDNVEIKVAAVLEVDGKEVELSKVQKQNWVKHRNSPAPTLEGNVNTFEVDGYPKSEADYKTYISGLVAEDLFKMMTNPQYFVGMKWKDQRDILMKFVSADSDAEMARELPEFADLLPELEKAPSTDDIQKKFSKALSEWKKKQAEIPVRIDELSKSLVDIDVAEQELAKADLERTIAALDEKIANAGNAAGDLRQEEMNLQFEMSGIAQTMNRELTDKRRKIEYDKDDAAREFGDAHRAISEFNKKIESNNLQISKVDEERKKLGEQYRELYSKVFDEVPYMFDESKWVFDEKDDFCPQCGQRLPDGEIEQRRTKFETRKVNAKDEADKRLAEAKSIFINQKDACLERIKKQGFEKKELIEALEAENESLLEKIDVLKEQERNALAKQNELAKQLEKIPAQADYMLNTEYAALALRRREVLEKLESMKSAADVVEVFEKERMEHVVELDITKAEIAKATRNVEIEERIGALEEEQKEVGQKVADQEKMLYLLEQFIKVKMLKISESINSKFNTVSWKLFEVQLNGGMKECCECTVNGVPFSTLNSGHRIVAGLDIINSLSELYGVSAPIFIDNAESVNEFNLPDMDTQLILLSVTEDKELVVS